MASWKGARGTRGKARFHGKATSQESASSVPCGEQKGKRKSAPEVEEAEHHKEEIIFLKISSPERI